MSLKIPDAYLYICIYASVLVFGMLISIKSERYLVENLNFHHIAELKLKPTSEYFVLRCGKRQQQLLFCFAAVHTLV